MGQKLSALALNNFASATDVATNVTLVAPDDDEMMTALAKQSTIIINGFVYSSGPPDAMRQLAVMHPHRRTFVATRSCRQIPFALDSIDPGPAEAVISCADSIINIATALQSYKKQVSFAKTKYVVRIQSRRSISRKAKQALWYNESELRSFAKDAQNAQSALIEL